MDYFIFESPGLDLSSRFLAKQVLLALMCFTSLFGMGKGGATSRKRPKGSKIKRLVYYKVIAT